MQIGINDLSKIHCHARSEEVCLSNFGKEGDDDSFFELSSISGSETSEYISNENGKINSLVDKNVLTRCSLFPPGNVMHAYQVQENQNISILKQASLSNQAPPSILARYIQRFRHAPPTRYKFSTCMTITKII